MQLLGSNGLLFPPVNQDGVWSDAEEPAPVLPPAVDGGAAVGSWFVVFAWVPESIIRRFWTTFAFVAFAPVVTEWRRLRPPLPPPGEPPRPCEADAVVAVMLAVRRRLLPPPFGVFEGELVLLEGWGAALKREVSICCTTLRPALTATASVASSSWEGGV